MELAFCRVWRISQLARRREKLTTNFDRPRDGIAEPGILATRKDYSGREGNPGGNGSPFKPDGLALNGPSALFLTMLKAFPATISFASFAIRERRGRLALNEVEALAPPIRNSRVAKFEMTVQMINED